MASVHDHEFVTAVSCILPAPCSFAPLVAGCTCHYRYGPGQRTSNLTKAKRALPFTRETLCPTRRRKGDREQRFHAGSLSPNCPPLGQSVLFPAESIATGIQYHTVSDEAETDAFAYGLRIWSNGKKKRVVAQMTETGYVENLSPVLTASIPLSR